MLKISGNIEYLTRLRRGGVRFGDDSRAERDRNKVDRSEFDDVQIGNNEVWKKDQKKSKSKNLFKFQNLSKSKKTKSDFFTSGAKKTFTKLR